MGLSALGGRGPTHGQIFSFALRWNEKERSDNFPFEYEPKQVPFGSYNQLKIYHHALLPFNFLENENVILHTGKYFRKIIKSNQNQIVFTIFLLIWNSKRTLSVCCSNSIGAW